MQPFLQPTNCKITRHTSKQQRRFSPPHLDVPERGGSLLPIEEGAVQRFRGGGVAAQLLQFGECVVQGHAGRQGPERALVHASSRVGGVVLRSPGCVLEPRVRVVVQVQQALQEAPQGGDLAAAARSEDD